MEPVIIMLFIGAVIFGASATEEKQNVSEPIVPIENQKKHIGYGGSIPTYIFSKDTIIPTKKTIRRGHSKKELTSFKDICNNNIYVVNFDNNSVQIRTTKGLADFLKLSKKCNAKRLEISGYASPEGTLKHNKKLSERRAEKTHSMVTRMKITNIPVKVVKPSSFIKERVATVTFIRE